MSQQSSENSQRGWGGNLNLKKGWKRLVPVALVISAFSVSAQEDCPSSEQKNQYQLTMDKILKQDDVLQRITQINELQEKYRVVRKQYDECMVKNANPLNQLANLGMGCDTLTVQVNSLADQHTSAVDDLQTRTNLLARYKQNLSHRWPLCRNLFAN
ncbi:MAG: hypothetical protein ACK4F6_06635 [Hylemonella sp.]